MNHPKITVENQHFAHIDDPEVQVVIAMALTDERIKELQILVGRGRTIPSSVVDRTGQLSALALNAAAWTPEPLMADMLNFIIRRTRAQVAALEVLKAQSNGHNHTELHKTQRACLRVERVASMALEYPESFRAAYQAGQPEKMHYTEGGPLGGIVTDAVLESVMPVDHQEGHQGPAEGNGQESPMLPSSPSSPSSPALPIQGLGPEFAPESPEAAPPRLPRPTLLATVTYSTPTTSTTALTDSPAPPTSPPSPFPSSSPSTPETGGPPEEGPHDPQPPGQDVRPDAPPGQEDTPAQPPGQDNRPADPPNQGTPGKNN